MSLIISLGSNLNDRVANLSDALEKLCKHFNCISLSNIYESGAVDYLDQPDFLNQVAEFALPNKTPQETMSLLLEIENELGRIRAYDKGPRIIDIDIIFWNNLKIQSKDLIIPHESWAKRDFIIKPLTELKYFAEDHEKMNSLPLKETYEVKLYKKV